MKFYRNYQKWVFKKMKIKITIFQEINVRWDIFLYHSLKYPLALFIHCYCSLTCFSQESDLLYFKFCKWFERKISHASKHFCVSRLSYFSFLKYNKIIKNILKTITLLTSSFLLLFCKILLHTPISKNSLYLMTLVF